MDGWSIRAIQTVLNNEKYTGRVILGKTFTDDFPKNKQRLNRGQQERYLAEDAHEPITTSVKGESNGQTTLASNSTTVPVTSTTSNSQGTIPNQNQVQNNCLELVSQGITYQLIEHWVYSVQDGVSADGKWFDKLAVSN